MKKNYLSILFVLPILFAFQVSSFAQAPDTVVVPQFIDGNPVGAMNTFIESDTTVTGERNNPNRVYLLERGKTYLYDRDFQLYFPLTLIGAPDPGDGSRPAVIQPAIRPDGSIVGQLFHAFDDITLKDFISFGTSDGEQVLKVLCFLKADSIKATLKGLHVEGINWLSHSLGVDCSWHYEDIYMRRSTRGGVFAGGMHVHGQVHMDTLIYRNNTMVNCGAYFIVERFPSNYVEIDHNTIVNTAADPLWTPQPYNWKLTNNLFVNVHAYGQNKWENDNMWFEWGDGNAKSLISADTISADWEAEGYLNADRKMLVDGNAYYWDQKVKDFWNSNDIFVTKDGWNKLDTIIAVEWMDPRTQAFFDDDEGYPGMIEGTNYNVDPQFTDLKANYLDTLLTWARKWRELRGNHSGHLWTYDEDGDNTILTWPFPEDLTYSNTTLLTGGTDGFPVGDLNWYPDKKAEWLITDVETRNPIQTPKDFRLEQNYPNPFNPSTSISFSIPEKGIVSLKVYNIVGEEVGVLINKNMEAGTHKVKFNASNLSSGVYFYRLTSGSFVAAKKLILLK